MQCFVVIDNPLLASSYPLSFKQLANLIQTADEILNTLLRDLRGEVVAQSSTNYNDVKNIFEILKAHRSNSFLKIYQKYVKAQKSKDNMPDFRKRQYIIAPRSGTTLQYRNI